MDPVLGTIAVAVVGAIGAAIASLSAKSAQGKAAVMQDAQNVRMAEIEGKKLDIEVNREQQKANAETIAQLYKLIDLTKEESGLHGEKAQRALARVAELQSELNDLLQKVTQLEREVAELKAKLREQGIEVD